MPNLSSYTKATEASILASAPTADGEMAYSTDTNKLFLSDGTSWVEWNSDGISKGSYSFDANTTVNARPYRHIDLSDTTGMKNDSGSTPSNGDTISEITCKSTGKKLTQEVSIYQPKFISSAGTTPIAGTSHTGADTDALIGGKSVLQFKNSKTDGQTWISDPPIGNGEDPFILHDYSVFMVYRNAGGNNSYPSIIASPVTRSIVQYNYGFFSLTDSTNVSSGASNYLRFQNYVLNSNSSVYTAYFPVGYRNILYHTNSIRSSSQVAFTNYTNTAPSNTQGTAQYIATDLSNPSGPIMSGLSIGHGVYGATNTTWAGEMGEIIFFREILSPTDANAIGAYLSSKWGIDYTDI